VLLTVSDGYLVWRCEGGRLVGGDDDGGHVTGRGGGGGGGDGGGGGARRGHGDPGEAWGVVGVRAAVPPSSPSSAAYTPPLCAAVGVVAVVVGAARVGHGHPHALLLAVLEACSTHYTTTRHNTDTCRPPASPTTCSARLLSSHTLLGLFSVHRLSSTMYYVDFLSEIH
jgi:hypothetical protein